MFFLWSTVPGLGHCSPSCCNVDNPSECCNAGAENAADRGIVTVAVPSPLRGKETKQWNVSEGALPDKPLPVPKKSRASDRASVSPVESLPRASRLRNAGKRKAGGG
jgi:hypothetical protein